MSDDRNRVVALESRVTELEKDSHSPQDVTRAIEDLARRLGTIEETSEGLLGPTGSAWRERALGAEAQIESRAEEYEDDDLIPWRARAEIAEARVTALEDAAVRVAERALAAHHSWQDRLDAAQSQVANLENVMSTRFKTDGITDLSFGGLLDLGFLGAMARQLAAGNRHPSKSPNDWRGKVKDIAFQIDRGRAIRRHLDRTIHDGMLHHILDDTGESNWTAVACAAMMCHVLTKPETT